MSDIWNGNSFTIVFFDGFEYSSLPVAVEKNEGEEAAIEQFIASTRFKKESILRVIKRI